MREVPKGWGYELWIANSEKYCGKLLFFEKGKRCSLHYHKLKDETFYLQSGKVNLLTSDLKGLHNLESRIMNPGDSYHISPLIAHQIVAIEESELFEFSTEHFDSDSYRIVKGS